MGRSVACEIAGNKFELIYTVAVNKQIGEKFGSMAKFIEKLAEAAESEDTISVMDDMLYVFVLMANQSILIGNHFRDENKPMWDMETIEMLFSPADVILARDYLIDAINAGNSRTVQSEDESSPNADAGQ